MKIATWNVERLKHHHKLDEILKACEQVRADILVLTETDMRICPNYPYCFHTPLLVKIRPGYYKPTENRVSIFTKYECIGRYAAYDHYTALCIELKTECGNLLVYGTIIGIFGNRHPSFMQDLKCQLTDFQRLTDGKKSLCICGDFNCSFSDNYYFTKSGRDAILQSFSENRISLLTAAQSECIDHIAVSERAINAEKIQIEEWNCDKRLSDHKGIAVSF